MSKKSILFYVLCALILIIVGRKASAQMGFIDGSKDSIIWNVRPSAYKCGDTLRIRDTIYQPVPLYQSLDTSANVYLTKGNRPVLKPCFIVVTGFKQQGPKGMQWVQEPVIKAIYSKRWKLIDMKKIQKIL